MTPKILVVEDDSDGNGFIPSNDYRSARNFVQISNSDEDYMSLILTDRYVTIRDIYVDATTFNLKLNYNQTYYGDLYTYLLDTYNICADHEIFELVVMDTDNIYKISSSDEISISSAGRSTDYTFDKSGEIENFRFQSWDDYKEGMYITGSLRIFDSNGDEVMDIRSNSIPLTPEMFSLLVGEIVKIVIEDEMVVEKLDVVNKIDKKIVSVARPDDYKSNIIKPVFYRAYPSENIELHGNVTFNIGVDLDQYKSKVDKFSIQIEGITFQETGRVPGYVIFKIVGEKLPKENISGTYYIVDGDGVLVTTGKYSYVD